MRFSTTKVAVIAVAAFAAGLVVANLSPAFAEHDSASDLSERQFIVFIDEVKQNLVFGDRFKGSYARSLTLSDGSVRDITLTPMVHDGMQVVELRDTGGLTYMAFTGNTTNRNLLIQIRDEAASQAALTAQGWKIESE